ncbi:uncharacterized protein CELE_F07A11.1 [Caenorhabditis elegans]|uniref:Uncharacterized protein n=1 Tax=Caenorhabditis elegans TaxID=6239 RepID=Q19129_CAEEL|nr:Uncharacterized protein CELE_F07A11.1 [Caenorhabditis elegans]CAA91314.3 Uncharacterized protein CELE_F07A11.1 [Caenorhabditis elegans]|eukprot:NP_496478.3 Uncharacterized protein CELE_F07A11.1 [Caenorhabditis elegans]
MRYGKVYFYDRMGNREPSEADKIREALDNFEAPRFRPPDEPRMMKNYTTQFSPLDTPPPMNGTPPIAGMHHYLTDPDPSREMMDLPANISNFGRDDASLVLPANLMGGADTSLPNIDRYKMDLPSEIYPNDPMPRGISTPPMNMKFNLGENIGRDVDRGVMNGFGAERQYQDPMIEIEQNLGNIRFESGNEKIKATITKFDEDYYGNEICAQCQAEDAYMDRMRRQAEEERRKYEETMKRAKMYEDLTREKEETFKREEAERNKALRDHVDRVNAEMIEMKKRRPKSPVLENYIFRHESPRSRDVEVRTRKDAYRAELDRQVEEKRLRRIAEFEKNEAIDATSNARAALEFANAREAERKSIEHAKEMARKQLEFQMEMSRVGAPSDKNWLWWAERPDEHGWRDARLKGLKHTNQVERNQTFKQSIGMLEEFKARQAHDDMVMRDNRRAKYDKLRDQLHENSKMLYPLTKTESRPIIVQPDPRVEAAWREAHEKYDRKFAVLQDNAMKSISGAALDGVAHATTSCRRCARCARPMERKTTLFVNRGETILPHQANWHS